MNVGVAVVLAGLAVSLNTTHARGQEPRAERPYRGVFGGGDEELRPGQTLALNWTAAGAYDDNATSDVLGFTDPRYYVQGRFGTAAAALSYGARGEKTAFTATGTAGGRYYPEYGELSSLEETANWVSARISGGASDSTRPGTWRIVRTTSSTS